MRSTKSYFFTFAIFAFLGACSSDQQEIDGELETEQQEEYQDGDEGNDQGQQSSSDQENEYGEADDAGGDEYGSYGENDAGGDEYGSYGENDAGDAAANALGGLYDINALAGAAEEATPSEEAVPDYNPAPSDYAPVESVGVAPVGSADRSLKYIAMDGTPVFSSPEQGNQVASLNAGDVIVVTMENGWAKIDDAHWVPLDALSDGIVPRVAASNPWR